MSALAPRFERLLASFTPATLHGDSVVCGLWASGEIAFVNDTWLRTAKADMPEPDRWSLGSSYFEPMGKLLEPFYRRSFTASLDTGLRWDQTYFCNTPEVERHFSLTVFPLEGEGLLTVHTLAQSRPIADAERISADRIAGRIEQCPHCRRVKALESPERWLWVTAWVRSPPALAMPRLCPPCADFYR